MNPLNRSAHSRRSLLRNLAALPAVAIAASVPSVANAIKPADDPVIALSDQFLKAARRASRSSHRIAAIVARGREGGIYDPPGVILATYVSETADCDIRHLIARSAEEIREHYVREAEIERRGSTPERADRWIAHGEHEVKKLNRRQDRLADFRAEHNLDKRERTAKQNWARVDKLAHLLITTPATTLEGAVAKFDAATDPVCGNRTFQRALVVSVRHDLKRLSEGSI